MYPFILMRFLNNLIFSTDFRKNSKIIKFSENPSQIRKGTCMCPRTNVVNQIDHVVVNKRHSSNITDVKSCRGLRCNSDHSLIKVTLRKRLSNAVKSQGKKRKRWNIDKLKKKEHLNLHQKKINEKLEDTDEKQDLQIEWNEIKNVIVEDRHKSVDMLIIFYNCKEPSSS